MARFSCIALVLCVLASAAFAGPHHRATAPCATGASHEKVLRCPAGYSTLLLGERRRCYLFHTDKKSFYGAREACKADRGRLAKVELPQVFNFIKKTIGGMPHKPTLSWLGKLFTKWGNGYWIGGRRVGKVFKWLDGTKVQGHWLKNQPDGGLGLRKENCVSQMYRGWNDYPCSKKTRYICERSPAWVRL